MPPQPGEVLLLTLFADLHYFFGPPNSKPPHHRFDKGSYVYLYHNPIQRRGRLEIANNAGTSDQDAFTGYLDCSSIENSHKHPTLFTVTVDPQSAATGSPAPSPQQDMSQWHLPTLDQSNQGKYMFKLHTVDIYFWTVADSDMFRDSLKRFMVDSQLRILDAPAEAAVAEHRDTMSPVVQKLEQAAISSPPYQGRSESISTTKTFPGPPTVPTPGSSTASPPPASQGSNFAPMAYNPAAPAAPEPIAHREPTPPPVDAATGTGLSQAQLVDQGYNGPPLHHTNPFAPQQHQQQQQSYLPGPPTRQTTQGFPPPPPTGTPPTGITRTNTQGSFPPPPPQTTGSQGPPVGQQYAQSFAPPPQEPQQYGQNGSPLPLQRQNTMPATYSQQPQQQYAQQQMQYANYPASPGFGPNAGTPLQSPSFVPAQATGPPPGGYSQYQYGQHADQGYGSGQAYRPTEHEAGMQGTGNDPAQQQPQRPGGLEARARKLEKGVGGFLKRLDKKF
ncbi:hypothetical protein M501DRAFT_932025 [Patellaria atrata CBS 101060]|uniref:Uncharacterized protein n=1 Tax=Patellaria atrata CBS 101060 TaxID=1346257 RepID=A0A9P4SDB8_9PEZI|nr:hypothetical protein M501DRAFT_932025 [Patellaria atrata CBS 101060]